ncbi:class I SAM-dependent methyltransferase [Rhodococcus aetherivorans]|uniref:Class I SAM-dependent methyltransferase n=1 Tax=Rhodococcus aetherivorans TaxID=191292 RepID=A0AA46NVA9_9NOCA|nr:MULTISPECIES: class I SAM-dependent methyltransferase [Rhodococcus]MDV6295404.1 class I SAM-dependent methyltransferase [Rhodococcus aetherivorans]PND50893.1 SAM-dependent methyltransferase [Rhodococcus sp. ENV425]QIX48328.1 class I SAM-dependent methyltransferase [Rhodococcus sp. DMU1]UGQ41116.1 class I SAM-dependent methyltransferase [Rhodococcus aetherivorans]UYF94223.1 class I SAM-dependent methyltransferase [Rhodococcus aetherivorans]
MPENQLDEELWDERYRSRPALWSGEPNRHLVGEAAELEPGLALDVGCGEGADAIWLARRGWRVDGVDVSGVALRRAAEHADRAGAEIAGRITWLHENLTAWDPGRGRYDLVSAQYMHLPPPERDVLFRGLAEAVAPGGTLLIVGHHPTDLQTTVPRPPRPELFFTGADVVALLDPDGWDVVTEAAVARSVTDPDGRAVTVHDTVVRARRR